MATNLELDPELLREDQRLGGHKSKRAAVEAALREYVRQRRALGILELFGTVESWNDYDYKSLRDR